MRARYVLSEGDAAAYLPSKSHGLFFFGRFSIRVVCVWGKWSDSGLIWCLDVGNFLRMFLGPINVRANRKDVQLKVKEEYNNYRV